MTGFLDGIGDWLSTPNTPQQQKQQDFWTSLMRGGAAMMERSGPSRMPTSFGQVLGSGLGATSDYLDQRRAGRTQEEMQRLQIAAAKRKAEEEAKRQEMLKTASPEAQQAYIMGGAPGYSTYMEGNIKRQQTAALMKSIFGPQQAPQPMAPQQAPQPQQRPPPAWPQGALPPPPAWPQQQAPQQAPQPQQAPPVAQQPRPAPPVAQPPMGPQATGLPPSAVNNMARTANPDDMPATIRQMVASGQLPRGQVMLALSSKDPGTAMNKLVNDFRRPVDFEQKLEERYTYWRKEVAPFKVEIQKAKKSVQLVNDALKQGTGTGDYFAVQTAQRMADDAVVRKEDVETIVAATSMKGRVEAIWAQAVGGTILTPPLRAQLAAITGAFAERLRQNNMERLLGSKGMADHKVQRRWTPKIVDPDFLKTYGSPSDISTDPKDYQDKETRDAAVKTPKKATSAIARKWADKTMTEVNAAHKAGTLTQKQVEIIMKDRGL